jgi:hypothetical protein
MPQHLKSSQPVYFVHHADTIPFIPQPSIHPLDMPGFADSFWSGDYAGGKETTQKW